jgi:hypothetical protein
MHPTQLTNARVHISAFFTISALNLVTRSKVNAFLTRKKPVSPLLFLCVLACVLTNETIRSREAHGWNSLSCLIPSSQWGWSNLRNWWQYLIIRLRWLKHTLTYSVSLTACCKSKSQVAGFSRETALWKNAFTSSVCNYLDHPTIIFWDGTHKAEGNSEGESH